MLQNPPSAAIQALRQAIRAQEDSLRGAPRRRAVRLGLPEIDAALPWGGLPAGSLHEICAASAGGTGEDAAALAFAAFLAGRFQQAAAGEAGSMTDAGGCREVVWCRLLRRRQEGGLPYGPGLRACGLDPAFLVLAEARREEDLLWALEEALRDGRAAAILGEVGGEGGAGRSGPLPDIALRRLQLAAERAGRPLLLLRPEPGPAGRPCPSLTRWRVQARPSRAASGAAILPPPTWRLDLLRCRGGQPGQWEVSGIFGQDAGEDGATGSPAAAAG